MYSQFSKFIKQGVYGKLPLDKIFKKTAAPRKIREVGDFLNNVSNRR